MRFIRDVTINGVSFCVPMTSVQYLRHNYKTDETHIYLLGGECLTVKGDILPKRERPEFTLIVTKDGRWLTLAVDAIAYLDDLNEVIALKDGTKIETGTPVRVIEKWLESYAEEFECYAIDLDHTKAKAGPEQIAKTEANQALDAKIEAEREARFQARMKARK